MAENRATEYLPRCYGVYSDISCGDCPYRRYEKEDRGCIYALHEDALALLKAQEPRMVALDEIKDGESYWLSVGKEFTPRPVICVHREDDARKQYITFAWQYGTITWGLEDYGKTWCCWTSRPTNEQRKAVKRDD